MHSGYLNCGTIYFSRLKIEITSRSGFYHWITENRGSAELPWPNTSKAFLTDSHLDSVYMFPMTDINANMKRTWDLLPDPKQVTAPLRAVPGVFTDKAWLRSISISFLLLLWLALRWSSQLPLLLCFVPLQSLWILFFSAHHLVKSPFDLFLTFSLSNLCSLTLCSQLLRPALSSIATFGLYCFSGIILAVEVQTSHGTCPDLQHESWQVPILS